MRVAFKSFVAGLMLFFSIVSLPPAASAQGFSGGGIVVVRDHGRHSGHYGSRRHFRDYGRYGRGGRVYGGSRQYRLGRYHGERRYHGGRRSYDRGYYGRGGYGRHHRHGGSGVVIRLR